MSNPEAPCVFLVDVDVSRGMRDGRRVCVWGGVLVGASAASPHTAQVRPPPSPPPQEVDVYGRAFDGYATLARIRRVATALLKVRAAAQSKGGGWGGRHDRGRS